MPGPANYTHNQLFGHVPTDDISQGNIIKALNWYLANSRIFEEKDCILDPMGVCLGATIASETIFGYEDKLRKLLSATKQEIITPETEAWKIANEFVKYLPTAQNINKPYLKVHAKQLQASTFEHAGLKTKGKFIITFTVKKLQETLEILKPDANPVTIIFMFYTHAIKIRYENQQYHVYDPNNNGTVIFNDSTVVAQQVLAKYLTLNKLPENSPPTTRFNAHVFLVQKEDEEQIPVSQRFTEFLEVQDYYSRNLSDGKNSVFDFMIHKADTKNIPNINKSMAKLLEAEPYIEFLFYRTSVLTIEKVMQDPFFKNEINKNLPYSIKRLNNLIKHFKNPEILPAEIRPEMQLVASYLYLLIKKDNQKLEDILERDYQKFGEPRLIRLLDQSQLINIANNTTDLQTRKVALEACTAKYSDDDIHFMYLANFTYENVTQIGPISLLNTLYFRNRIDLARQYLEINGNNPAFQAFFPKVVENLVPYSILDNNIEWFNLSFSLANNYSKEQLFSWLTMAIKRESPAIFSTLFNKILSLMAENKITYAEICGHNPIYQAINYSGHEFLSTVINHLKDQGILQHYINGLTARGENPVHHAVYRGKAKHLELLLAAGALPDIVCNRQDTPLLYACASGNVAIVKILFNTNQYLLYVMPDNRTILNAARNSINPNMLKELIHLFLQKHSEAVLCKGHIEFVVKDYLEHLGKYDRPKLGSFLNILLKTYQPETLFAFASPNLVIRIQDYINKTAAQTQDFSATHHGLGPIVPQPAFVPAIITPHLPPLDSLPFESVEFATEAGANIDMDAQPAQQPSNKRKVETSPSVPSLHTHQWKRCRFESSSFPTSRITNENAPPLITNSIRVPLPA
jgi:ankyrin repeat protein